MQSINILTINEKVENETDIIKVIENAKDYFPKETWGTVQYLGKVRLEYDVKIAVNEESLGAFLFEKLIRRIRKVKGSDKFGTLLVNSQHFILVSFRINLKKPVLHRKSRYLYSFLRE